MNGQKLGPCTLEGKFVRLEPLREEHANALFAACKNLTWEWVLGPLRTKQAVESRIAEGIDAEKKDEAYAFAVVSRKDDRVIGSTSYLTVISKHKRAEIGSTWYSPEAQGTVVNPECKYLLLNHAFEDWSAVRIQLVTDTNNVHSQRAILKLGAKFEARLRNYGIRPDGSVRDAFLYSLLSTEWPDTKSKLQARIQTLQN